MSSSPRPLGVITVTAALLLMRPALGHAQVPGAAPPAAATQPRTAAAGDTANGKTLYLAHQCWACHGYTAETGTRLLLENGSFVGRMATVERFTAFLRAPNPNQPPPARSLTSMPSYGVASLPDAPAADLFAYIRSLKPTQPPLSDIPLLMRMSKEGGRPKK